MYKETFLVSSAVNELKSKSNQCWLNINIIFLTITNYLQREANIKEMHMQQSISAKLNVLFKCIDM